MPGSSSDNPRRKDRATGAAGDAPRLCLFTGAAVLGAAALGGMLLLAGCVDRRPAGDGFVPPRVDRIEPVTAVTTPQDAIPRQRRRLAVQLYTLYVPRGQVSGNRELWRRIDEQSLDPGTYDVLWANGVRAGTAPLSELAHVAATLNLDDAPSEWILAVRAGRQVRRMTIEEGVGEQTIFWFDRDKRHHGRTFQRSSNLLSLAFEPTPNRPDEMRISLTPVVRALDARTVVTTAGADYQVAEVRDEALFDLRLLFDVPFDHFVIVAPSEEVERETSLGRRFFTATNEGQEYERVYLMIPWQHVLEEEQGRAEAGM